MLTTPVIRCLRKKYPEATIHFLCKTSFATILESNPYLDKVLHFQKDISSILPQLKKEGYTDVVDLHKNLRSIILRNALRVDSHTFHKANWAKWLIVNLKIDRLPKVHIVDRYMAAVKELDVDYDGEGLDYFIPEKEQFKPADFGLDPQTPFLTFAIGAAHATKRLPLEKIAAICSSLSQKIVLIGGPSEKSIGTQIAADLTHVINTCGSLNLHQSADAVRQSTMVITHDTGMMHIAAAFRKKIVSVWGNTIPGFGMYPFYPDDVSLNESIGVLGLSCRPCSKIGFAQCPKGHFRCMNDIDTEEVRAAVLRCIS